MISQLVTMNVALVLLFTFNMMKLEAYTYLASIKFDDSGEMYISLGNVNISLSSDYELTISDRDCTKTLSLKPPTEEENIFKHGYRPGSSSNLPCEHWLSRGDTLMRGWIQGYYW
ncbi:unnamed protein product [Schistosoma curassoni]|nr:unnamed protein product [Schistosoma curassoni]